MDSPLSHLRTPSEGELKAMDWRQLHISLQWIYRGAVPKEGQGEFSGSCGGAAWYLLRGTATIRDGAGETSAGKGDWVFPTMGAHYREFSPDAKILSIRFYIEWPDGEPLFRLRESKSIPGAAYPDLLRRGQALERAICAAGRRSYTSPGSMDERLDFRAYLRIGGVLFAWSDALYHTFSSIGVKPNLERFEDERIVRALRVLDQWPLHETFPQTQLARQAGIGQAQLNRLFVARLGLTPRAYFNRRRIRYAEKQVQLPDQIIKEVAFDVGFRHVSSFSAWFKQNTGSNPNHRKRNH